MDKPEPDAGKAKKSHPTGVRGLKFGHVIKVPFFGSRTPLGCVD